MKFLKKIVDGTPGASPLCLKMVKQGEMCHFMKVNAIHEFLTSLDLRAVDEQCVCIMCLHNFR